MIVTISFPDELVPELEDLAKEAQVDSIENLIRSIVFQVLKPRLIAQEMDKVRPTAQKTANDKLLKIQVARSLDEAKS